MIPWKYQYKIRSFWWKNKIHITLFILSLAFLLYLAFCQRVIFEEQPQILDMFAVINFPKKFAPYIERPNMNFSDKDGLIISFDCTLHPNKSNVTDLEEFKIGLNFSGEYKKNNIRIDYYEIDINKSEIYILQNNESFNLMPYLQQNKCFKGNYSLCFNSQDEKCFNIINEKLNIDPSQPFLIRAKICLSIQDIRNKISLRIRYQLENTQIENGDKVKFIFTSEKHDIISKLANTDSIIGGNLRQIDIILPEDKALDMEIYMEKTLYNLNWAVFSAFLAIIFFLINLVLIIIKW